MADGDHEGRKLVERIRKNALLVMIIAASASGALLGKPSVVLGIVVGGIAALVNFHWLEQAVGRTITAERSGSVFASLWRWGVRYIIAAGLLYLACRISRESLLAVFAGLNIVIVAIMVEGVRMTLLSFSKGTFDA